MLDDAMNQRDCHITCLSDRGVLRVSGDDAHDFLQGLITTDVNRTGPDSGIHAALLTPQGKILHEFFVVADEPGFLIDCRKDGMAELMKRLGFYKLRAAVEFEDLSESHSVWAVWGDTEAFSDAAINYSDPRLGALGLRLIAPNEAEFAEAGCSEASESAYHDHRIGLGVPEGGRDYELGDTFPHEAVFDQLNGVDFSKGCFVGQEVVSRMEHRGTARKRIVPVRAEAALPDAGPDVDADGTGIGKLGSVSDRMGLALLRLDRAEKAIAQGKTITAGGTPIELLQPDWASFQVPRSEG